MKTTEQTLMAKREGNVSAETKYLETDQVKEASIFGTRECSSYLSLQKPNF